MKNDEEVLPVYAYRDDRTEAVIERVHNTIPFSELYRRTGCQFQLFNTVYQIFDDMLHGRLEGVTDLLMMPEYLLWKLCGTKSREYTNATTTGMVNAQTGQFDMEIVDALGYPKHLFPKLCQPGTVIGEYEGIKCVLCATHDTASAVEGIPMEGNHPYISSGTVRSAWKVENGCFHYECTVPANTTALLTLPNRDTHHLGSGTYQFSISHERNKERRHI